MERMHGEDKKSVCSKKFMEMINVMATNITDGFCDASKLKSLCLLDP